MKVSKIKPIIQRTISRLPRRYGDAIYHSIQVARGLNVNFDSCVEFVDRLSFYLESFSGRGVSNVNILEL